MTDEVVQRLYTITNPWMSTANKFDYKKPEVAALDCSQEQKFLLFRDSWLSPVWVVLCKGGASGSTILSQLIPDWLKELEEWLESDDGVKAGVLLVNRCLEFVRIASCIMKLIMLVGGDLHCWATIS